MPMKCPLFGSRRRLLGISVCLGFLAALSAAEPVGSRALNRYEFERIQMATKVRFVIYGPDEAAVRGAATSAFDRVEQLESRLSDYREDSELVRASQEAVGTPQVISPDLYRVLARATEISRLTSGAFDVTVKPLVRLWKESIHSGSLPDPDRLNEAKRRVGIDNLLLNPRTRSLTIRQAGVEIDLGAIAKGFIADEAWAVLRDAGFIRSMVDAGGDLRLGAPPPAKTGWSISIDDGSDRPQEVVLHDCGIATSGDRYQSVEIAGRRYSHIVDPRTGLGLTNRRLVTVIAPDAVSADALATGLSILDAEPGLRLVGSLPRTSARIVFEMEGRLRVLRSPGFPP